MKSKRLAVVLSVIVYFIIPFNVFAEDVVDDIDADIIYQEDMPSPVLQTMQTGAEISLDSYLYPDSEEDRIISNILLNSYMEPQRLKTTTTTEKTENELAEINQTNIKFENGDYFWIRRYDFKETAEGTYYSSFTIPGNEIHIRYVDGETGEWVLTSDLSLIPKTTLYITTDLYSMIISVPASYKKGTLNNTLEYLPELERPVVIKKGDGNYLFELRFARDADTFGEIWALQSHGTLVDWSGTSHYERLKPHDLSLNRRWSSDGYYFTTPSNYVPSGDNVLYRHPANYTGASWAKYGGSLLADNLGYIMMKTCISNQNDEGFWATGPKSLWLESDFGISENFYDTRFNTDFATALIISYQRYYDLSFLAAAIRYAEFFYAHAEKNHYDVPGISGDIGWLVQDYAGSGEYLPTHVSLNHQLAEINFLYEIYKVTKEDRYYVLAEKMLSGIRNSYDEWVLPDNNLRYALHYDGTYNVMVDYPYLTYNDLFMTKKILKDHFDREEPFIQYLMDSKKLWMDNNNVTEYIREDK